MPESNRPDHKSSKTDHNRKNKFFSVGFLLIVLLGLLLFGVIAFLSLYFQDAKDRVVYLMGSLLNALMVMAIVFQAFIYHKQWKVMGQQWEAMNDSVERSDKVIEKMQSQWETMAEGLAIERAKTNPRLRVSNIRIENFEAGQSPIFITTIANDGFIDATGIELHIGIKLGHNREFNWIEPQTVVISARGEESYPIVTGASLSEQDMEDFKTNVPIEVKVRVKYWPGSATEPTEFCYRYLPWPSGQRRPDDVRQFFPCSFIPGLNIGLRIQGAEMKMTAGNVTPAVQKNPPEEPRPKEARPDGKEDSSPD